MAIAKKVIQCLNCSTFQSASETISSATNSTLIKIVNFSRLGMMNPADAVSCVQKLIKLWSTFLCVKRHHEGAGIPKMTNRKYDVRQRP